MHSNKSVLEAHFSLMRMRKGETPLEYAGTVGTLDTRHQLMAIENSPMNDSDFIQENSPIKSVENVLNRMDSHYAKVTDSWLATKKIRKMK